ncbi:adhesion G protein-coupled receptor B2-like isoform X2 [Haliotis rufescens]|nr:adhesion G protein-coupled receptor B2-like isoform X2 [Haliotis rufescens]
MATVEVQINDDDEPEDAEQFRIILSGDSIGAVTSTSAIIADNDFYSPWGQWVGDCSVTCGPANKTETRNRTCIAVRVSRCKEALTDSRIVDCNLPGCPTGWSQWGSWTKVGRCRRCRQRFLRRRRCLVRRCRGPRRQGITRTCDTPGCPRSF